MGGYGSGYSKSRKQTVEETMVLRIPSIIRNSIAKPQGTCLFWRFCSWTTGSETTITGFLESDQLTIKGKHDGEPFIQNLDLIKKPIPNQGFIWYAKCPACKSMRMNLHFAPSTSCFLCRECLNLAYSSSQNSRKGYWGQIDRYMNGYLDDDRKNETKQRRLQAKQQWRKQRKLSGYPATRW